MSGNAGFTVELRGNGETARFAAAELERCLKTLEWNRGPLFIELEVRDVPGAHPFDDGMDIDVSGGRGVIRGANQRSLLMAVYRYLREAGFRFLFPGRAGEVCPAENITPELELKISERPRYRHRGVCIEGADSIEIVEDMIDFLPKLGLNSYFIQFRQAHVFFRRWYRNTGHPVKESREPFPTEQAEQYVRRAEAAIKKRGLIYHAVGHGWTCDPFGIPGLCWDKWDGPVPEEAGRYFAQVDGRRELWGGVPLNTSICMSNKEARRIMADAVVEYALERPFADIVHVWLADGDNNQCECESCRKKSPSDWYVTLLNEIDAALSAKGLATRIVFLIYCELLWPPETERIENERRFTLMFAPISRSYRESYGTSERAPLPAYERNCITLPQSAAQNLSFLSAWQHIFRGDSFDFDYHYMWAHHKDAGGINIARILHEDVCRLESLGLSGYMSCQVQRAMAPNALGITALARALWGGGDFDSVAQEYFRDLYADHADAVMRGLTGMSDLCHAADLEKPEEISLQKAALCRKLCNLTGELTASLSGADAPAGTAFDLLRFYLALWSRLAQALEAHFEGDSAAAHAKWEDARAYLWENEPRFAPYIDCFNFDRTYREIFSAARQSYA